MMTKKKRITVQRFAGILANQLMRFAVKERSCNVSRFLPVDDEGFAVSVHYSVLTLLMSSLAISVDKAVTRSGSDAKIK